MKDEEIIGLYFLRDEDAIRQTDIKYGRLCRKISCDILHCDEDGEECVNTSYFKIWNTIPPLKPVSFITYLCTVVKNTALTTLKKLKRYSHEEISEEMEAVLKDNTTPEKKFDEKQTATLINSFLEKEKPRNRRIFISRYYLNLSVKNIAEYFGMTEQGVLSQLCRTRAALKKYLCENGERGI